MMVKLDIKDRKILSLLDENCRYSNSQIAKKVGLSKPAVEYRIQKLIKNQAIFNFLTVIDFTKLGYSQYKLYFKFQNASLEDEKKMINHFSKQKNIVWIASLRGKWDLAVSVLAKNNFEFALILKEFMNKYSNFILEKDVLLTEYSPLYSRDYLSGKKNKEFLYGIPSKAYNLDKEETLILKELSTNARINIVDLAEKIKLSRDVINYRLKNLLKEKVIVQFSIFPNLKNIGINHYKIIFRTINFNEKAEHELGEYIANHKKATQLLKLIGNWDIEIELETESEDELHSVIADIRQKFSNIIRDFDVIKILENYKFNFFPF
jgi:DNA-binding Lrp family transcriptional regulator